MSLDFNPEFLVNTKTLSSQETPVAASLADGGFVIVWEDTISASDHDIKAQIYNADLTPRGEEFRVNAFTENNQQAPAVTGLASGGFVVTWQDFSDGVSSSEIVARFFDAEGTPQGGDFEVNTQTTGNQWVPSIVQLTGGRFVVTWQDDGGTLGDASAQSIKAQIFYANGDKMGSEFLVNTNVTNGQFAPEITALTNGGFVITWDDESDTQGDTDGRAVKAKIFNADGGVVKDEFRINTHTAGNQQRPDVAALSGGGFVMVWQDHSETLGDSDSSGIHARMFDNAGNTIGPEFLVNVETGSSQTSPKVTALAGNAFVVVWADKSGTLGDDSLGSIKGRVFNINGAVGEEFLVNTETQGPQAWADVCALPNGGFVVTWEDNSGTLGDASGKSIKATVFDAEGRAIVPWLGAPVNVAQGTPGADVLKGDAGIDALFGDKGHDKLIGYGGNDYLIGEGGNDTLKGGSGDDTLFGGVGKDLLDGGKGRDLADFGGDARITVDLAIKGAQDTGQGKDTLKRIEDLAGGTANDVLKGNAGANLLMGREGDDKLIGRGGADTLDGGAGVDKLTGGKGADVFIFTSADDSGVGKGNRDVITDFGAGADVIDLSGIDADTVTAGDQGFTFIGAAGFSGTAGELRFTAKKKLTLVQADLDGDGLADFEIELTGKHALDADDFLL